MHFSIYVQFPFLFVLQFIVKIHNVYNQLKSEEQSKLHVDGKNVLNWRTYTVQQNAAVYLWHWILIHLLDQNLIGLLVSLCLGKSTEMNWRNRFWYSSSLKYRVWTCFHVFIQRRASYVLIITILFYKKKGFSFCFDIVLLSRQMCSIV